MRSLVKLLIASFLANGCAHVGTEHRPINGYVCLIDAVAVGCQCSEPGENPRQWFLTLEECDNFEVIPP